MAGALSATVTGYVAKDPEPRANGKAQGFSIPVSKGRDKPTTWVRVTAWGKDAEYVAQYIRKGSLVTVSGEMELREYESAKGQGTSLELNAHRVTSFRTEPRDGGSDLGPSPSGPSADDMPF